MVITDKAVVMAADYLYRVCDIDVAEIGLFGELRGGVGERGRLAPFKKAIELAVEESENE